MRKSILALAALVVLTSSTLTASAQSTTNAMGGCNPRPQVMAMGGCNPRPQVLSVMYSILAYLGL